MYRKKMVYAATIAMTVVMVFGSTFASASSAVLKKESQGNEVTALQNDLKRLGYLSEEPTGYFGKATEEAVKKVQKEYGYGADGIAGGITLSLLDRLRGRNTSLAAAKSVSKATTAVSTVSVSDTSKFLKEGDESNSVKTLQTGLIKIGYLNTNATGFYGPATATAVKSLQRKYGYKVDGIAGSATLELVSRLASGGTVGSAAKTAVASVTTVKTANAATTQVKDTVKTADAAATQVKDIAKTSQTNFMPAWYGNVEKTFPRGGTATIYDIKTGLSFNVKRTYGTNHADCETITTKDTAIMKKIYNGVWSWERRAIIISVDGLKIAASMTGLPHAGLDKYTANKGVSSRSGGFGRGTNLDAVKGNNMNGHFDIHFYKSRNHYNNKIDPKHQALVKEAAKWAEEQYK